VSPALKDCDVISAFQNLQGSGVEKGPRGRLPNDLACGIMTPDQPLGLVGDEQSTVGILPKMDERASIDVSDKSAPSLNIEIELV